MQSICGRSKLLKRNAINFVSASTRVCSSETNDLPLFSRLLPFHFQEKKSLYSLLNSKIPFSYCCGYFLDNFQTKNYGSIRALPPSCKSTGISSTASSYRESRPVLLSGAHLMQRFTTRHVNTLDDLTKSDPEDASASATEVAPRIKFKRLDKTARHIMQILDKEAVEEVRTQREIPDIRPGYIIQLRLEVPENKRRVSTVKGIVIARRNAGLNSTIRLRRLVAGVGVESLLPLYSPNIKEMKVLDKKKVRRAKLYYLRDKMNALKK